MALSAQVPLVSGERVRVRFTLPDHQATLLAESMICWSKTGHLGVRFESIRTSTSPNYSSGCHRNWSRYSRISSPNNFEKQNSVTNRQSSRKVE